MIRRLHPCAWLVLFCVACQWLAPSAIAPVRRAYADVSGVTCTARMTDLSFGNIDEGYYDGNRNLTTGGYISYYCDNTTSTDQKITACFSVSDASPTLANGNKAMRYQLSQDVNGGVPWVPGGPIRANLTVPAKGHVVADPLNVYATIEGDQTSWIFWFIRLGLPAGYYSAQYIPNSDVRFDIAPGWGATSCTSGGGTINTFNVSATIKQTCLITATNTLDFGQVAGDPSGATGQADIGIDCLGNPSYRVGLDNGRNYGDGSRRMRGGPTLNDFIPYELYQDSQRTVPWGNDDGSANVKTGTRSADTFTVYGKIPPNQGMPPPGKYFDVVTVYVYY